MLVIPLAASALVYHVVVYKMRDRSPLDWLAILLAAAGMHRLLGRFR